MYEGVKALLLSFLHVPPEPLDPMGDVRSLRVFRASPGYLRYLTVGWALSQLVVFGGALVLSVVLFVAGISTGPAAPIVIGLEVLGASFFVAQAVGTYFLLRLHYELRWYKVTDRSLRIRAGVVFVNEMTMTFANVQNITVTQGPLERLFGISDVRVDTAGGGGDAGLHGKGGGLGGNLHVGVFRGVDDAEMIRDLMLERLRRVRDTGLGDPDETHATAGAPAQAKALGADAGVLSLLAAFRDEARALRLAAERAPTNRPR
jgi:membrane protein YdbS with pleckstrin-like domain